MYQLLGVNSAQVMGINTHLPYYVTVGRERAREACWLAKRNKCQDSEITWSAVIYKGVSFGSGSEVHRGERGGSNSDQSPVKVTVRSSTVC